MQVLSIDECICKGICIHQWMHVQMCVLKRGIFPPNYSTGHRGIEA